MITSHAEEKLIITGYSHDGAGVGRLEGKVVFVPGALEGEEVLVQITGKHKGIYRGQLVKIISQHKERVKPLCQAYDECGGCRLQHVSYQEQLKIKERIVRESLSRIGGIDKINVLPVLGMEAPWEYRNKGHFQVGFEGGRIVLGFFETSSHQLVSQPCAHLFPSGISNLVKSLEDILTAFRVTVDVKGKEGLRYVLIRESRKNGDILLIFVSSGQFSPFTEKIAQEICKKHPDVVGVCQNFNGDYGGLLLGKETLVLEGKGEIEDSLGPFTFKISPSSFFQVNNTQAEVLYNKALEYAGSTGREEVIDAYCGIGTITLFLAQSARMVYGIELSEQAVEDARNNGQMNGFNNVEFIAGEAEKVMPQLVKEGITPEVVVVDPPRRGCGKPLLESILEVQPRRVVYISCNPTTLARDLKYLGEGGYVVKEVQPVDMFPQTGHVEVVALLYKERRDEVGISSTHARNAQEGEH